MTISLSTAIIEGLFREHERFLWGLCYRLTGNAADADDLVQETFVRAMQNPPARTGEPWRPWLVRVAMNLGRDLLRRRRRRGYVGPWLPSPIETGDEAAPPSFEPLADEDGNPATRYDLLESVSFAFLLALEALTPAQRAVLLLRDVFDYSVRETAEALGMSEANVKTTHHRARRAMQDYNRERHLPTRSWQAQTRRALEQFLSYWRNHDVAGMEALLADNVRHLSDGGGEFFAARVPVIGREKVIRFYTRKVRQLGMKARFGLRMLNGIPALIAEIPDAPPGYASRTVTMCELDAEGRIRRIYTVLASRKLNALSHSAQEK